MNLNEKYCQTKYPILLVHGFGLPDKSFFFNYWGKLPEILELYGAKVFLSGHPISGSHADNAQMIKNRIIEILKITQTDKINIIAHSKGGIESRYMLSKLDMADYTASLTTLSTPHQGSTISQLILENRHELNPLILLNTIATYLFGLIDFNTFKIGEELTPDYMKAFNKEITDAKGVYYRSYGGLISNDHPSPLWSHLHSIMLKYEGENDGLVSVKSYQWGDFKRSMTVNNKPLVSHFDLIGLHQFTGVYEFDSENFFIESVRELKDMGY